jgi:hypothetical protein
MDQSPGVRFENFRIIADLVQNDTKEEYHPRGKVESHVLWIEEHDLDREGEQDKGDYEVPPKLSKSIPQALLLFSSLQLDSGQPQLTQLFFL